MYPIIESTLTEKLKIKFDNAIAAIENGVANGAIANPVFIDAKSILSQIIETAWQKNILERFTYYGKWESLPIDLQKLNNEINGISFNTMNSIRKKIAKINGATEHPFGKAMLDFINELEPLANMIEKAKEVIVKRKPKSEEERQIAYSPPKVNTQASKRVLDILNKIAEEHYNDMIDYYKRRSYNYLEQYKKKYEEYAAKGRALTSYDFFRNPKFNNINMDAYQTLSHLIVDQPRNGTMFVPVKFEPNIDEIITSIATKTADDIKDAFVYKNLKKLVSILDEKQQLETVEELNNSIDMGNLEGQLRFTFTDGSSFDVKLQAVYSYSVHGTPFVRFPLTFHNVFLPGGVKMPQPNEEKMNTIFSKN